MTPFKFEKINKLPAMNSKIDRQSILCSSSITGIVGRRRVGHGHLRTAENTICSATAINRICYFVILVAFTLRKRSTNAEIGDPIGQEGNTCNYSVDGCEHFPQVFGGGGTQTRSKGKA